MENGNGDETENENRDGDGDEDRDDLDQESAQLAAISPWWDDLCCDTEPGTGGLVGALGPIQAHKHSSPASPEPQTLTGMHTRPPRRGKY